MNNNIQKNAIQQDPEQFLTFLADLILEQKRK